MKEKTITNKPNFLVVGVPKGGTSSLCSYLKEHPEIYLPEQKELHYFSYPELIKNKEGKGDKVALTTVIKEFEDYKALYDNATSEKVFGDISPSYLFFANSTIPLIKKHLGTNVKIIITLRDPIDRAFSNFLHQKRLLNEDLMFNEAIKQEENRKKQGYGDFWRYAEHSLYYEKCKQFIDEFGRDNVKIILFENMKDNAENVIKNIYEFLDVDSEFTPSNINEVFNKGGVYKKNRLTSFFLKPSFFKQFTEKIIGNKLAGKYKTYKLKVLNKNIQLKPLIEEKTLKHLKTYFKDDIEQLKTLQINTLKWKYFNKE